jgi:hypothetical protein
MNWDNAIIAICILLAAIALYFEYRRERKAHLVLRLFAVVSAITALACLILPLTYTGAVDGAKGKINVLLTDGFNADSINKTDSVYTLDNTIKKNYPKAKLLTDITELFADTARIAPTRILGYGLNQHELGQLKSVPVIFHPGLLPDGITAVSWTEQVNPGRQFIVEGTFKNSSLKARSLLLKGLNTTLDSVTIPANTSAPFTLSAKPKNSGRTVYHLAVLNGKDTIEQEDLPLTIEHSQPIKVLVLSASPDFETKFLKNWLGGEGYSVASRSLISKGKFGQEYVNMDQPGLTKITAGLLSKFDLVVGDLSVLKDLSAPESSALQQEVTEKGLGIIVRSDSSSKAASWLQSSFPLNTQAGKQASLSSLNISSKGKTAKLTVDPAYIVPQNNTQALVTDETSHALAAVTLDGAGKLIFTTINNSYSWMLAGNKDDYTALWSTLIDKALRKTPATEKWLVASSLPMVNTPVTLISEGTLPVSGVKAGQTMLYPAQNPAIPFQQTFTYWPASYGWQQVTQHNGTPFWWYTWPNGAFASLNTVKKTMLTSIYAKNHPADASVTKQIHQTVRLMVPKIYFYMLFLAAAIFLWAESKFFSS